MKYLVIGTWSPSDSNISRLLKEEQQRTGELVKEGFVQQLFLRSDGAGGFMVVSEDSMAAANERLATLPFMKAGVMEIELVELSD